MNNSDRIAPSSAREDWGPGLVGGVNMAAFPHHKLRKADRFKKIKNKKLSPVNREGHIRAESLRFTQIHTYIPRFEARVDTTGMGGMLCEAADLFATCAS